VATPLCGGNLTREQVKELFREGNGREMGEGRWEKAV
jgi:hypothetical protein